MLGAVDIKITSPFSQNMSKTDGSKSQFMPNPYVPWS